MAEVWQMGSGETGRDFLWLYFKHDIMLKGGGDHGDYRTSDYSKVVTSRSPTNLALLKSFVENVAPGDIVLLRHGRRAITLGVAHKDGYSHNENFDDVYGWDLQHIRRVIWQDHLKADFERMQKKEILFGTRKQIPSFTRLKDEKILEKISPLFNKIKTRPLKTLPPDLPDPLSMKELGQELFSKGLPNNSVDAVIHALERQRRLLKWYRDQDGTRPGEHEVVAHLIIPILLALGWSEQLLAVEWKKIDLAGFSETPTSEATCALVCEAKGPQHGLMGVLKQAQGYVDGLNLKNCRKILLAGGTRFYLYEKKQGEWNDKPVGYINLEKIRTSHLAPPNTNAVNTIMALTPAGVMRKVPKS